MNYPRQPAAFINTIAESGTKDEAIKHLQGAWDELVILRHAVDEIAAGRVDAKGDEWAVSIATEAVKYRD